MTLVDGRWIAGKIEINTDDRSQSPEMLSFAIRGFQLVMTCCRYAYKHI